MKRRKREGGPGLGSGGWAVACGIVLLLGLGGCRQTAPSNWPATMRQGDRVEIWLLGGEELPVGTVLEVRDGWLLLYVRRLSSDPTFLWVRRDQVAAIEQRRPPDKASEPGEKK